MAKKKQRIQNLRRQQAWLIKERERITEPWRLAIFKLRDQLEEECLSHPAERRRFQNRRLIDNLIAEIGSANKGEKNDIMLYWLFCGSPSQDQLGYDEARQQHYAELKALGLCLEFQPQVRKANIEQVVTERFIRLDSLARKFYSQGRPPLPCCRPKKTRVASPARHRTGAVGAFP